MAKTTVMLATFKAVSDPGPKGLFGEQRLKVVPGPFHREEHPSQVEGVQAVAFAPGCQDGKPDRVKRTIAHENQDDNLDNAHG